MSIGLISFRISYSSGDDALADIVQLKCYPLLIAEAGPAARKAYRKAKDRCDTIAEKRGDYVSRLRRRVPGPRRRATSLANIQSDAGAVAKRSFCGPRNSAGRRPVSG